MNQTARDFLIGLCSIVALVGLGVLLMRFGEINTSSRYLVTIPTVEAAVGVGSDIRWNGPPLVDPDEDRHRPSRIAGRFS